MKPVEWVGSSKGDLKKFPAIAQDQVGFALYLAQARLKHRDAKPLKGLGAHVLEVVSRHGGNTYRAVYTVRFKATVYVLHAFQKKGQTGHRDTEAGYGSGQAQAKGSGAALLGHL